ncbi:MAG: hypothetical protein Q8Q94_01590 [bacterium]|nr:hypothetical protein [bacterium]MDZ4299697.1 hypothetical protein [Candidatus Sungbacteria bacterium]
MFWIIVVALVVVTGYWITTESGQEFMRRLGWIFSNNNNVRFLALLLFVLAANVTYPFLCSFPSHEDPLFESTKILQDMYYGRKSTERISNQPSWMRVRVCSGIGWLAILGWPALFVYAPIAFNDEWHRALDTVRRRRESASQDLPNLPQAPLQQGTTPTQVGQVGMAQKPFTWRDFLILDTLMEFAQLVFRKIS